MPPVHVVVLAAGQGKRMHSDLPKVLHKLAGRPLLEHVLDAVLELDAASVHVVHGHGGSRVREQLGHRPVRWVEQPRQLGTGHAVGLVMPDVPDEAVVVVVYGDVPLIEAGTLRAVIGAAGPESIGLLTVELGEPAGYGRILRDAGGAVRGIVEERDADAGQRAITEINTGIVAAGARRLREWLGRLDTDNAQSEYYLTDVVGMAAGDGVRIAAVQPARPEEILGVNDRVQLADLERRVQRREARRLMLLGVTIMDPERLDVRGSVEVGRDVVLDVNVVLEGRVVLGDGVAVGPHTCIRDSEVGPHTSILAHCVIEGAAIGQRCRVGPFARIRPGTRLAGEGAVGNFVEIKNTTLGPRSKANHLTYLGDSEIGRDVNVGAGTITCNYDGASKHRTVIADGAFIGSGVELVAPVTVEAGATIGAGSTICRDAPADTLTVARARQTTIKGWKRPAKK